MKFWSFYNILFKKDLHTYLHMFLFVALLYSFKNLLRYMKGIHIRIRVSLVYQPLFMGSTIDTYILFASIWWRVAQTR